MRIGMILDSPFPPDYRVEKEAITLTKHGHEVTLFCLDYAKPFYSEDYKGFKVAHYPSNKLEYKLSALAYTFPAYHLLMEKKIDKFCTDFKPSVLHVHDMVIAAAAFKVAHKQSIPVVLDLHENRPASMREYRHLKKFPGNILINLKTWENKQIEFVKRANRVVVVTNLAKEDLVQEAGKQAGEIYVVPNTSAANFGDEAVDHVILERMKATFNLLYIGDTSMRRGTGDAIEALPLLRKQIPNIKLWIIGNSSADNELLSLASSLNVSEFVSFEGWQSQSLFTSYIKGSHICISPLKRNRHHDTTFANKVFQYMALGKPVVVSDCTAQAELVTEEKCGLVHEAGNIKSFSNCIIELFENEKLRESMGENARTAVIAKWNWELTSLSLVELYKNLKR
jgi:glycosyltransferase involved in cell wall biosynthesis